MRLVELKTGPEKSDVVSINPAHIESVKPIPDNGQSCFVWFNNAYENIEEPYKVVVKKINEGLAGADVVLTVGRGDEATRFTG